MANKHVCALLQTSGLFSRDNIPDCSRHSLYFNISIFFVALVLNILVSCSDFIVVFTLNYSLK